MEQSGTKIVAQVDRVLTEIQKADVIRGLTIAVQRSRDLADTVGQVIGKMHRCPNLAGFQDDLLAHYHEARQIFNRQASQLEALARTFAQGGSVTISFRESGAPTSLSDLGLGPATAAAAPTDQGDHGLRQDAPVPAAHNGVEGDLLSEGERSCCRPASTAPYLRGGPTQSEASAARLDKVA